MSLDRRGRALRLGFTLAAFSALLFAPPLEDAYVVPQRLALGLALFLSAWAAPSRLPQGRLVSLLLAYASWRVLCFSVAAPPVPGLLWLGDQALLLGAAFLGAAYWRQPGAGLHGVAALLFIGAAVSGLALLPLAGLDAWGAGAVDLGFSHRAHGSLGNPDFLGGWLALLLPLGLGAGLLSAGRPRWAAWAATGLMGAALALTQARASWLAGAIGTLVVVGRLRPRAVGLRSAGMALAAGALLLAAGFWQRSALPPRLAEAFDLGSDAWRSRAFMAGVAVELAIEHPIVGVGPGGFASAYLARQGERLSAGEDQPYRYTLDAHNDWAQIAAESGWLGLLLWAACWAAALRLAWRIGGLGGAAVAGGLAAFAVQACFHFPWAIWPSAALLMLGLGWAMQAEDPGGMAWPPWRRAVSALLFLGVTAAGLRQAYSSAALNSGSAAQRVPALEALAAPLFAKAAALRPDDARAWMRLGQERLRQDRSDEAIECFQRALQAQPSQPEAWVNLGLALGRAGSLDAAETAAARGVGLNPRSSEAWVNWSKVAWLRGDAAAAEARLRQGLRDAGPSFQASFNLGAILYNGRRFKEAAEAFRAALALQPGHADAARLLERALAGR